MRNYFDQQLALLKEEMTQMGALCEDAIALAVKLEGGCHHTAAMHSRNIENMNQMANAIDTSIFVKNGPCIAGLGLGGEGWTTMTITTPT